VRAAASIVKSTFCDSATTKLAGIVIPSDSRPRGDILFRWKGAESAVKLRRVFRFVHDDNHREGSAGPGCHGCGRARGP
jgi:hypothetical protein